MIKKFLLGIVVFLGLGLCFSNSEWVFHQNGTYFTSTLDQSIELNVVNKGQLMSQRFGNTRRLLAFASSLDSNQNNQRLYFMRGQGQKPYYFINYAGKFNQGYLRTFYVCPGGDINSISGVNNSWDGCTSYNIDDDFSNIVGNFFQSITINDYWGYDIYTWNCYGQSQLVNRVCFMSSNLGSSVCFSAGAGNSTVCGCTDCFNLDNSVGFATGIDFTSIPDSFLSSPPGFSNSNGSPNYQSGNGGLSLNSTGSALNYYEKTYGWDESICYVGVDNVTDLYGQNGVSFQEGKGLSIFDTFEALYGNRDINKVYVWLNVQLFNYENRYNIPGTNNGGVGHPSWLGNYNSGTNQIDLYYDDLTFPFANKPVALYFMANNIVDQSPYSTMGSEVVSYCNIKINNGTFDEIIDQSNKNNINDYSAQHNTSHGLNSDGSDIEHDGYFGSGVNIAFSGNTSIKNTLKNFFDEFDKALKITDINTNNRILPTWLVTAFIFVVLFKFLRKR